MCEKHIYIYIYMPFISLCVLVSHNKKSGQGTVLGRVRQGEYKFKAILNNLLIP